jgi:hypothetical protein
MHVLKQFRKYLTTSQGRTSLVAVVICALALAFVVGRTFVEPLPRKYKPDFGAAKWIELPEHLPAAYFRKSLYISGPLDRAWLELAATGHYDLYVNDILVDQRSFACVRVSGVYDLKRLLSPGKNVIAIYVPAGDSAGQNQMIARGFYAIASSPLHEFLSDSTWKVAATPTGVVGSYLWSSPLLDDTLWVNAKETRSGELFSTVEPVAVDPRLFAIRPSAKWITTEANEPHQVSFLYSLNIPWVHGETWIQIAANGGYDLIVNGRVAAVQPVEPQAALSGPEAPVMVASQMVVSKSQAPAASTPNTGRPGAKTPAVIEPGTARMSARTAVILPRYTLAAPNLPQPGETVAMPDLIDISPPLEMQVPQLTPLPLSLGTNSAVPLLVAYNISQYASGGSNSIQIFVHTQNGPVLVLAEGYVEVGGGALKRFRTDQTWHALYSRRHAKQGVGENALVVGQYEDSVWGPLPQVPAIPTSLPGWDTSVLLQWAAVIAALVAFTGFFWIAVPSWMADTNHRLRQLWTYDAGIHLLILALIFLPWMLSYDVRLPADWCFTPAIVAILLVLIPLFKLILLFASPAINVKGWRAKLRINPRVQWYVSLTGLGFIVLIGMIIRAHGLLESSIGHDEANIIAFSKGVLKAGFPYVVSGSYAKLMATYELVPYPVALSSLLLGPTELAYRIPSLIFGSLNIALVGLVGYRMMDWRVGLLAALIYAFLPMPIGWARDLFYPSQEAFFALLTFWFFFEAVRTPELNSRFVRFAALAFIPAYFTWEGSAFILPTLFLAALAVRPGQFQWMTNRHLWRCFLVISAIVILQLCYRTVVKVPDFLGVVYDLSEVTSPSPVFLKRLVFDPLFYLRMVLFNENQVVLSLLTFGGMLFVWRNPAIRYLCISLLGIVTFYTCWLPHYSDRYCFNAVALLVLASASVFFASWDRIRQWQAGTRLKGSLALANGSMRVFLVLLIASANPFMLKTYRLAADPEDPPHFGRLGQQSKPDYRLAAAYTLAHARPGDIIITRMPQVFNLYAGEQRANYSINTSLAARMYYDGGFSSPFYGDKHVGLPSICDLEQLEDVISRHRRIWLIRPTYNLKSFDSLAVTSYLKTEGQVMAEGALQQVILLRGASDKSSTAVASNNYER